MSSILWKWWPAIFLKGKTPLDSLVNQNLEYGIDGQAHKWEDNCIWKPPVILLPFASVLLSFYECSSSEFSLWLLLCNVRLRVFDGSWLNLTPPTWDLTFCWCRQDQRGLSAGKLWQMTEFNSILAIPFLADHMVYNSKYSWWCWNHQFCQQAAQLVSNFKMKGNYSSTSGV